MENLSEDISPEEFYNPLLNGNLNLLNVLIHINPTFVLAQRKRLYDLVQTVLDKTLSNDNRLLGYALMLKLDPKPTLLYLYNLIESTKPT